LISREYYDNNYSRELLFGSNDFMIPYYFQPCFLNLSQTGFLTMTSDSGWE